MANRLAMTHSTAAMRRSATRSRVDAGNDGRADAAERRCHGQNQALCAAAGETAPRPAGEPIMAIVSIKSQQVTFYDADGWILRAPVSTGIKGRETPAGIFALLEKDKDHHSSLYDDAWMPNMQRITWNGIALHGGPLPGYAASHGCIRMPFDFAEKMFDRTRIGMRVIISPNDAAPVDFSHPALFEPNDAALAAAPVRAEALGQGGRRGRHGGRRRQEGCRRGGPRGGNACRSGAQAGKAECPRRRQTGRGGQGDRRRGQGQGARRRSEAEGGRPGRRTGAATRRRQGGRCRPSAMRRRRQRTPRRTTPRRRPPRRWRARRRPSPRRRASWKLPQPAPTPKSPPPTRRSPPRFRPRRRPQS